jgi:tetratricopeptide (TPR) repeat protein
MIRSSAFRRGVSVAAVVTLAATIGGASAVRAEEKKRAAFLSPAEMTELGDKSKVKYGTKTVKDASELPEFRHPGFPKETQKPLSNPMVSVGADGSRSLSRIQFSEVTLKALEKAEERYQAKQYLEALEIYRSAAEADPKCAVLHLNMGDCYLLSGNAMAALEQYEKATALNPADFHGYWFQGNALAELKKYDKARHAYARALAMSPRYPGLIEAINKRSEDLGVKAEAEIFHPKAMARPEGDSFVIHTVDQTHWWLYGLCKAIWLAEPDHREALTGHREHRWTNTEELECTANLVALYHTRRDAGETPVEPELDRLLDALGAQQLGAFVSYEFGSRFSPEFVLYLDETEQERVAGFVEKFVFQPK